VQTLHESAQMRERYAYLVSRFPDPSAEPTDTGKVAPVPDSPDAAAEATPATEGSAVGEQPASPPDEAAPAGAAPRNGPAPSAPTPAPSSAQTAATGAAP
jgi:hypothetical protein